MTSVRLKSYQMRILHHSHKKQRTKLYQNPFFFTGHQNVKQTKEQGSQDISWICIFTFFIFFSFLCQDANKTRLNCTIIGCNLSKKHKLTLYKSQHRQSNYVDHKFFLNFYQELPVQNLGDRHPNTIEMASCLVHVLCDFNAT